MKTMKRGIAQITDATVAYGVVAAIIVILLIPLSSWAQEMYRMYRAGEQANQVQRAVNRYIADQQSTIAANSSASTAYTLTVPMLITAGYLPQGYSPTNAFASTYRTLIYQPAASKFHTMTFMTGGTVLNLSQARTLAGFIGAAGGYIENGVAKGAQGGWLENLSAFGGFNPGDGTVVIAGFYNNGAVVNDYLYRHSVAGHPELNTMGTALNMGNNDINNANNVNTQTVNASGDVNAARLTATQSIQSNGWINANGNLTSQSNIWAAGDSNANGSMRANGNVSAGNDVHADGNLTTNNSVYANGNITANNDVVANGNLRSNHDLIASGVLKPLQVNNAGSFCDTWGAISHDNSGAVLSCVGGVWKAPSVTQTTTTYGPSLCNNRNGQSIAYCPQGYRMLSGGYEMTQWFNDDGRNSPDSSYPDASNNAWVVTPPGSSGGCVHAVAMCGR
ncbi:shufflon system plasmid conjugative transfer pilus tip adhesin PilV (plasmid) [Pantoea stewartii]|nr:shufflon system plasmid conjugative transfer pilus tip adhesin PilV [Pantoea stewartii]